MPIIDFYNTDFNVPSPTKIVKKLSKYIIAQENVKKGIANAIRNNYRRNKLDPEMKQEVMPKNILMTGPTGSGKTEISRRLAMIVNAPFIKVDATKYTEVGFVGKDTEHIIKDLIEVSIIMCRKNAYEKVSNQSREIAEDKIVKILMRDSNNSDLFPDSSSIEECKKELKNKLKQGLLDDRKIEIYVKAPLVGLDILTSVPMMEDLTNQISNVFKNMNSKKSSKKTMNVKDAIKSIQNEETENLIDEQDLKQQAIKLVEERGIVFIDEIDKICSNDFYGKNAGISREGVQRDLLPIVEGCTVNTKYGIIKTDQILFIASGSFHNSKPSDLIPELQGRFPVVIKFKNLNIEDFIKILTEPRNSLIKQYKALIDVEKVKLEFTKDGINEIARISWEINDKNENIGARRLYSTMEELLKDISFTASENSGKKYRITKKYVQDKLSKLIKKLNLEAYII